VLARQGNHAGEELVRGAVFEQALLVLREGAAGSSRRCCWFFEKVLLVLREGAVVPDRVRHVEVQEPAEKKIINPAK
jgi:hypothetical protein